MIWVDGVRMDDIYMILSVGVGIPSTRMGMFLSTRTW
jgi:hypothetical protein